MNPAARISVVAVTAAFAFLLAARGVDAASGDADGTYTVTVTKVEASKDGGTTYTTIFEGSQAINIASVNAGAVAAGLASGVTLDVGTYNVVRVTIGDTLVAKGYVNDGGHTYYTDNSADGSGRNDNVLNTPGGDYTTSSYTIPQANRTNTTTGLSIQVQAGVSPTVRVSFDTSGVLSVTGGAIVPGAPAVSITSS